MLNRLSLGLILFVLLLHPTSPTLAHDNEPPRIEITSNWLNPGGTLELRSINLAPEQPAMIFLVGSDSEYWLGEAAGDAHGDFVALFVLPIDLPVGVYTVKAVGANEVVVHAPLTVAGEPILSGESGERDEDEPLLATLPPGWQPPTAIPGPVAANTPTQKTTTNNMPVVLLSVGGILVVLLGVGAMMRRRNRGANR